MVIHSVCDILLTLCYTCKGGGVEFSIQTYGFKSMFCNIFVYLMDLLMDSCANGLPYGFAYGFWQNRFTL